MARAKEVTDSDRQRYSPEERKQLILEAARRVLLVNPDASLEDIAEEAGITRQLVSRYFPGGGITPIAEALFDEFEHHFARIFVDLPNEGLESNEEVEEGAAKAISRFLDWAEEDGQPWLFGGEGASIAAHLAARRADLRTNLAMVILHFVRKLVNENDLTRIALQAEQRATDEIVWQMLTGKASRADCERILNARYDVLIEQVLPALDGRET
jgi:AcrR family transcriptional regulator